MSRIYLWRISVLVLALGVMAIFAPRAAASQPADNTGSFQVYYFNYIDGGGSDCPAGNAVATGYATTINNVWPEGTSPVPGVVNTENYMVCWRGPIYIPQPGMWDVYTCNDDGMNVWLNDQIWMNAWYDQGPTSHGGTFNVPAAGNYMMTVKMYNRTLGATARVAWVLWGQPNPVPCGPTPPPAPPPPVCPYWNPYCYQPPPPQPCLYLYGCYNPYPPKPKPIYPPAACYYRVRWGDTLTGIAWRFGTTTWQLTQWNHIYNPNYIYAGMVLRVC